MKTAIRGILFDKDGTLVDFNRTWGVLYQRAAEWLCCEVNQPQRANQLLLDGGYNVSEGVWLADSLLASGSNSQIREYWFAQLDTHDENGDLTRGLSAIFSNANVHLAWVSDDMCGLLEQLRGMGCQLGIATMDDEKDARLAAEQINITSHFDFICGADSGFGVKPEPGMVAAFCQACDLQPQQVMMVGDSPRDLRMGKNAGVGMTVGVLTGASKPSDLSPLADHVLPDITGIWRLLNQ